MVERLVFSLIEGAAVLETGVWNKRRSEEDRHSTGRGAWRRGKVPSQVSVRGM